MENIAVETETTYEIEIMGRTFEVMPMKSERMPYGIALKGRANRAYYTVVRYPDRPELMHAVTFGANGARDLTLDGNLVRLTDRNGKLEVA